MDQHLGALDVSQELMPEAVTFVRALDQPRQVGDHEAAVVAEGDDAEVWRERGERIVRDLRPRRRDARDQRRLAGVREPDKADVGEQLELQRQELLLARLTRLGPARSSIGRRYESR